MINFSHKSLKFSIYFLLSALFCFSIFFNTINENVFSISNDFYGLLRGFPSDSDTYLRVANEDLIAYHRNFGPAFIIWAFEFNYLLIFIVQFTLFQWLIYKIYSHVNRDIFLVLMSIPFISISTIFPNKELYAIYSFMYLVLFIIEKKYLWIIFSLIMSLLSRPELFFLIIVFYFFNLMKSKSIILIIIMLLFISIGYQSLPRMNEYRLVLEVTSNQSTSIALMLDNLIVNYYLYWLLFPFKIIASIMDGGIFNILIFTSLLIHAFSRSRNSSFHLIIFLGLIYGSIVSFPHFRYISTLYIFLITLSSLDKLQLHQMK
jgi:hypothetical protein